MFGPSLKTMSGKLKQLIRKEVERHGTKVLHVWAFGYLYDSAFWIAVQTDAERDRLLNDQALIDRMHTYFEDTGYLELARKKHGKTFAKIGQDIDVYITLQSQETVDRDYEGNWRYAMQ